jgi:YVTN family beta-propeller protein
MSLTISGTIALGRFPMDLVISGDGQHIYVSCIEDNLVSVIDRSTHQVVTTVPVGKLPEGMALSPNGTLYVCNTQDGTVSAINTRLNTVTSSVSVGQNPIRLAVSPEGNAVYVTSFASASLSSLNVKGSAVLGMADTQEDPTGVAVTPDGAHVYIVSSSHQGQGFLSIYDSATLIRRDAVALRQGNPGDLAITPGGLKTYVCEQGNTVSVIDNTTRTVLGPPIDVPTGPHHIVIHPDSLHAYVACPPAQTLVEIDLITDTVTQQVTMNTPENMALSPDGRQLFVTNTDAKTITVLDT